MIPAIVSRDAIAAATARMMTISTLIGIAGPPIGGVLVSTGGGSLALLVDALSYLIGALLLAGISTRTSERSTKGPSATTIREDIAEGLRYIRSMPVIRDLTFLGIGNSLAGGAVSGLVVVAAVRSLGLDADSSAIGVLFGGRP